MSYAENTSVSVEKSRAEIERLLQRYGADHFAGGWQSNGSAFIAFAIGKRAIRFELHMPDRKAAEFTKSASGRRSRNEDAAFRAWEQACRSRWRALALVIKAKLEAVAAGIATIEEEFLAFTVVPGQNRTVGQVLLPQLQESIDSGKPAPLMLTRGKA